MLGMIMYREMSWWYWLATTSLLTAGLAGWHWGFCSAGMLTLVQVIHFAALERSVTAFTVQVRVVYLAFLLAGIWEPMRWVYWTSAIGTWAMVLFGYCLLARSLSLLAWNRSLPLSARLVWRAFTTLPARGNVLQGLPAERRGPGTACHLNRVEALVGISGTGA